MARNFSSGSSQDLDLASYPDFSSGAASISMWVNPSDLDITHWFQGMDSGQSAAVGIIAFMSTAVAGDLQLTVVTDGAVANFRTAGGVVSTGSWQHLLYTVDNSLTHSNYAIYYNGSSQSESAGADGTGSRLATESIAIGSRHHTPDRYYDGSIAEIATWTTQLTAADALKLSLSYSPFFVKPAALVSYWEINGRNSPEIDRVGGYDMTLNAGPTWAAHPRVIMPSQQIIGPPAAAVDVAANINISPSQNYVQIV